MGDKLKLLDLAACGCWCTKMHARERQTSNVGDVNEVHATEKACAESSGSKELQYPLLYST